MLLNHLNCLLSIPGFLADLQGRLPFRAGSTQHGGLPHVERALRLFSFFCITEDNGSLSGVGVFRRGALYSHERSEFLLRIWSIEARLVLHGTLVTQARVPTLAVVEDLDVF